MNFHNKYRCKKIFSPSQESHKVGKVWALRTNSMSLSDTCYFLPIFYIFNSCHTICKIGPTKSAACLWFLVREELRVVRSMQQNKSLCSSCIKSPQNDPTGHRGKLLLASLFPVLWSLTLKVNYFYFCDSWYIPSIRKRPSFIKHDTFWLRTQVCKVITPCFCWHFWKHTLQILKYMVTWANLKSNARGETQKKSIFWYK